MANTRNSAPSSFKPEPVEPRPRRLPYRKTRSGSPVHFEPNHLDQFGDLTFIPACKCKSGSGILKKMCDPRCRTPRRPRLSATFNASPISGIRIIPRNRRRSVGVKEAMRTLRSASMPNCAGILKRSGSASKTSASGPRLRRSVAFQQSLRTIYEIPSGAIENFQRIPSETRRTSKRKGLGLVVKAVDEYDMRVCEDRLPVDRGLDVDSTGSDEPMPQADYEMLSPPLLDVDW